MPYVVFDSGIDFGSRYLTPEIAYFLGGICAANEKVTVDNDVYWVAPVRYNYGYATPVEIEEHFDNVRQLSMPMGGQTLMSENIHGTNLDSGKFRLPGFGSFFRATTLTNISDLFTGLRSALEASETEVQHAFILGAFDGRGSIDIDRSKYTIRYIVLDCPLPEIGDFLAHILDVCDFEYNYNTARDRVEGGEPRKAQLRIKDDQKYMREIGFISSKRFNLILDAYTHTFATTNVVNGPSLHGQKLLHVR